VNTNSSTGGATGGAAGGPPAEPPGRPPRASAHSGNWILTTRTGGVVLDLNPVVFGASSLLIVAFVFIALAYRTSFAAGIAQVQAWIANQAGWLLVLTVNVILGYLLLLLATPLARIRLGGPAARPEFSWGAWVAMLFSAGMGIGLVFYGVAEPLHHLAVPPLGAEPGGAQAYRDAARITFLHWGLHAWGIYALVGLALGYFAFNRGMPLSVRSVFFGLWGARVHGWRGHVVDVAASVATLFGVATSLGLGALQVSAGLGYVFGWPVGPAAQVAIIAAITVLATASVVLGLERGIKRLSVFNIGIAFLLLMLVFYTGPSLFMLDGFVQDVGGYLDGLLGLAFWTETYTRGSWQNTWTVFYWGWWIAWSPFVGLFIARISVGRTIREFIVGTLVVATLMTFAWLAVFGNAAFFIELEGPGGLVAAVQDNLDSSLFVFFNVLSATSPAPLPSWWAVALAVVAITAIVTFFVTSSDSGSLVIDMITSGGHPNPPTAQRVYWAVAEGLVAAVLLLGGGLAALQTAAISVGLPFAVVVLAMIVSLHKALRSDTSVRG
jgi:choline/glycine/proline betaine transport protein